MKKIFIFGCARSGTTLLLNLFRCFKKTKVVDREHQLGRKETCIKYPDPKAQNQTLYEVEVLGMPTLAWLTSYFHKEVKPRQKNYVVVLDHYIADFYVDMLKSYSAESAFSSADVCAGVPTLIRTWSRRWGVLKYRIRMPCFANDSFSSAASFPRTRDRMKFASLG